MISVVVIALVTGVALGIAGSALYVARDHAVGWLVVQHRQPAGYGTLPPSRLTGADAVGREDRSRWSARSEARTYDLDPADRPRTIQGRPDAGYPQITGSYDDRQEPGNLAGGKPARD